MKVPTGSSLRSSGSSCNGESLLKLTPLAGAIPPGVTFRALDQRGARCSQLIILVRNEKHGQINFVANGPAEPPGPRPIEGNPHPFFILGTRDIDQEPSLVRRGDA